MTTPSSVPLYVGKTFPRNSGFYFKEKCYSFSLFDGIFLALSRHNWPVKKQAVKETELPAVSRTRLAGINLLNMCSI